MELLTKFVPIAAFYAAIYLGVNWFAHKNPLPQELRRPNPVMLLAPKRQHKSLARTVISILSMVLKIFAFFTTALALMIFVVVVFRVPLFTLVKYGIVIVAITITRLHHMSSSNGWRLEKILTIYPVVMAISAGSIVAPSWITFNMAAMIPVYVIFASTEPLRFRYLAIFFLAVVLYDVINVWGTEWMLALVNLPGVEDSPLLITAPRNVLSTSSPPVAVLGSGDIALSSFGYHTAQTQGLATYTVGGFFIGLVVAFVLVSLTGSGVPAMLPISPFILGSYLLGSTITGKKIN